MICDLAIAPLLRAYRNGSLTPRKVLTELLQRSAAAPREIWIARIRDDQLETYLKRLENTSPTELPLYGIPFAVKDNIDLAGLPTTAACPAYQYQPERQFATGLVGVRSPYGAVPNRLAPGYVSGGSSSGSAAALAYDLCSFALGTDTAGSGRPS